MAIVEALRGDDRREVGPYRLLARLGSGSFGTVYAAVEHDRAGQLAAVKVARPGFADIADFPARFNDEIELIGRVESDFVPKLIIADADGNPAWIATELIPGPSLDHVVASCGPLPEVAVWHLGAGIAAALDALHGCGFAHRDLRPKNVLLVPDGPWVIDFNLARLVDIASSESFKPRRGDYGYMSPEEARHGLQAAEMPADIFALGATLVFAATGHAPFDDANRADAADARPNLDGLPAGLRDLVGRCLLSGPEKEAHFRPSLDEIRQELSWHARRSGRDGFAAALPGDIMTRLVDHRDELARILGARGPARLGWGSSGSFLEGTPQRPPAVSVRWTKRFGGWISGAIAVDGGRLAVSCLDGTVAVRSTADGEAPAGWHDLAAGVGLHAGPLLMARKDGNGTVYAGSADGLVHAIDLTSGRDRIAIEAADAIEGPPVAAGGRLCALSADGRIHAADPRTGKRTVLFRMEEAAAGAMSVAADIIFSADTGGRVYGIDATSGQEKWRVDTGGLVLAAARPAGEWLYVCGTDGLLRQIGITDGRERAVTTIGAPGHVTPACDGNFLYVASGDSVVHAYDISGHDSAGLEEAWSIPLGDEIAGLAAFDGRLFVTAGYRLAEVNVATRNFDDLLRMDSVIGAPPVISGRHCYVTGLGGIIACLTLSLSYSISAGDAPGNNSARP